MPVYCEKLPNENILVAVFENPYKVADSTEMLEQFSQMLEDTTGKVYLIGDMSKLNLNFGDMVQGLASVVSNKYGPLLKEERLHLLAITSSKILEFGVKALGQSQYGGLNVSLFNSLDDALGFARGQAPTR